MLTTASAQTARWHPNYISLSYFGEMATNPGAKISIDYTTGNWNKVKHNRRGIASNKNKAHQISLTGGGWQDENIQNAFFILPEYSYLSGNRKGIYIDLGAGVGYLNTPTTASQGPHNAMAGVHLGFGQDLSFRYGKPWRYFIKPAIYAAISNYQYINYYYFLEAGLSYRFW